MKRLKRASSLVVIRLSIIEMLLDNSLHLLLMLYNYSVGLLDQEFGALLEGGDALFETVDVLLDLRIALQDVALIIIL